MINWITNHAFAFILIIIILLLIGVIGFIGDNNSKAIHIIEVQRSTINNQQRVIEAITGIDIPEGYEAIPVEPVY